MQAIQVRLIPFTERGRLLYQYDWEMRDRVFYIKNPQMQQQVCQAYEVLTDDPILFSLDSDGVLIGAEFVIPRAVWEVRDDIQPPLNEIQYSMAFSSATIAQHRFESVAQIITDASFSFALVQLCPPIMPLHWVALSEHCYAGITDESLYGLYIRLTTVQNV